MTLWMAYAQGRRLATSFGGRFDGGLSQLLRGDGRQVLGEVLAQIVVADRVALQLAKEGLRAQDLVVVGVQASRPHGHDAVPEPLDRAGGLFCLMALLSDIGQFDALGLAGEQRRGGEKNPDHGS